MTFFVRLCLGALILWAVLGVVAMAISVLHAPDEDELWD